jgi:galactokinase
MARLGQKTENEWVGANTGIMDQMISANGQAGYALLIDCRSLDTQPIPLPTGTAVLIMDTMTRHSHTESGYNERRQQCEAAAAYFEVPALRDVSITEFLAHETELEPLIQKRARHVVTENLRTLNAVKAMQNDDAPLLGQLMNESHASLRDDFAVTNEELDIMARLAQEQSGCYGARMTGGGFGGCAVALVQVEMAEEITTAVATQYESATGLKPNIFSTPAAAGTAVVDSIR